MKIFFWCDVVFHGVFLRNILCKFFLKLFFEECARACEVTVCLRVSFGGTRGMLRTAPSRA
jgi:hypothetical protein